MAKNRYQRRLRRSLMAMGVDIKLRRVARNKGRRRIHFLHIGKTAGTQMKHVAQQVNAQSKTVTLVKHGHDVFLKDLPEDEAYFFCMRDPISRFRSGFYSRKRKGQPKTYNEWTDYERAAFETFEHANDLAEALFAEDETGLRAFGAMKSMRHTAQNQSDWFYCCGNFLQVRPPVWVLRQESFAQDLEKFASRAGLDVAYHLSETPAHAHRNDYSAVPPLSERAHDNLRRWYAQDFELIRACEAWRAAQN
ncbi:sulfotransferase family 2 domain-containing protein [Rhodovulum adriaticum]|uniref:Sulfotransferase family protein n=1 Tax=Rhodovulum adriaticum TaxID=35804 RepID=A0A4R2NIL7_RHOAD|nr:sulfotransferase family 2 domain-containing protein [Rhodovulum adriaticum]MBK1634633.1 hypothetical protein [Rhodovulum adriaticum]TCP21261.1 sulfotransferase family protein [Rhodovulum adriaticum]